jgi:hypothetical protein
MEEKVADNINLDFLDDILGYGEESKTQNEQGEVKKEEKVEFDFPDFGEDDLDYGSETAKKEQKAVKEEQEAVKDWKFEDVKVLAVGKDHPKRVFEAWYPYPKDMKLLVVNVNENKGAFVGGAVVGGYKKCKTGAGGPEVECRLPEGAGPCPTNSSGSPSFAETNAKSTCKCMVAEVKDYHPMSPDTWRLIYAEIQSWKPTHVIFEDAAGCGRSGTGVVYLMLQQWLRQQDVIKEAAIDRTQNEKKCVVANKGIEVECTASLYGVLKQARGKELQAKEHPKFTDGGKDLYPCLVEKPMQVTVVDAWLVLEGLPKVEFQSENESQGD